MMKDCVRVPYEVETNINPYKCFLIKWDSDKYGELFELKNHSGEIYKISEKTFLDIKQNIFEDVIEFTELGMNYTIVAPACTITLHNVDENSYEIMVGQKEFNSFYVNFQTYLTIRMALKSLDDFKAQERANGL